MPESLTSPPVILLAACVALLFLAWLARVNAVLSLLIGLLFLAVPVALWVGFDRRHFQSEGSAAGLVFFLVYAGVGVLFGTLGLGFAGSAVARIARGEKSTVFGRRVAFVVLGGTALALAGLAAWRFHGAMVTSGRIEAKQHDRIVRVVPAKDGYALAWEARGEARKLALAISPADWSDAAGDRALEVQETRDGPRMVELRIAAADAPHATLRLHRDAGLVDDAVLDALEGRGKRGAGDPDMPRAFWVSTAGGAGQFVGFQCAAEARTRRPALQCHEPDAPLARYVPRVHGLERVRLHIGQDRSNARCDMSFHYHDRVATVSSRSACFDAASVSALAAGVALLGRLEHDAVSPPSAAERLARASAAVARCDAADAALRKAGDAVARRDADARADQGCLYALSVAAAELERSPQEASALLLRALEARVATGGANEARYVERLLTMIEAGGRGQSRDAVRAHSLRVIYDRGERTAAVKASRERVASLAPRVLAADDAAFELADRATASASDPEAQALNLALLQAWHEKAQASAPGSDFALKARYALCRARLGANLQRDTLGACADELMAAWQVRAAAGKPFDMFGGEPELAAAIARMYYAYGYAAQDFPTGVAGVQQVRLRSVERFASTREYEPFVAMLQDLEGQLAPKVRIR